MRAAGSDAMPRRKKNGQSPARLPGGPPENRGNLGPSAAYGLSQCNDGAIANNFSPSDSTPSSTREKIVKSMEEMFSHLDPEVIYMVLSECDFKVDNAMDSLLELAADVTAVSPSPVSGFERTAALLSSASFPGPSLDSDFSKPSQQPSSSPLTNLLTDELDRELETLNAKQEQHSSRCLSVGASLSSFPPPPLPQQPLPELLQSSLKPCHSRHCAERPYSAGGFVEHMPTSSPLKQLSSRDEKTAEEQHLDADFTYQVTEMPAGKPKPPLDLAATGRPSAFQVYKKQDPSQRFSEDAGVFPSDETVGGARSKVLNQELYGSKTSPWNLNSPVFSPNIHRHQGPTFITPVAPSFWSNHTMHASHWQRQDPVFQAHLKPYATIPKSAALPAAPQLPSYTRLRLEGKVLVMLRGAPGSGKTTLARALLEHNPGGVILSTDDYFTCHGKYQFNPAAIGEAHAWNHKRAKDAFERGSNPIIIDNTNMQGWEMKPYVAQALKHGYKVLFREPDTWWRNKPGELKRRTTHHVPVETIRRMLDGYERFVTVHSIMGSHMPEWKQENQSSQVENTSTPCPDLVGEPGWSEGCKKSRSQLFSSLPDVSSIGRANEVGQLEDATYKSTESLNFQPTGRLTENPEILAVDKESDLAELDSEMDARLELIDSVEDQRIPDCIVESVMNEDHRDEIPVAFSLSIGQRVRRERSSRRAGFDGTESADLVKDANKSETEAKEKEKTKEEGVEVVKDEEEKRIPTVLNFVGDWPCEGSLNQRQLRRRERHKETNGKENEGVSQEVIEDKMKVVPGPDITKLQKVLDLIQTGGDGIHTCSSQSSPLSLSSEEEIFKEVVEGITSEDSPLSKSNNEEIGANVNRVNNNRSELPDCVLDWKAADFCRVRDLRVDNSDEIKTEMEDSSATGETDHVADICKEATNILNSDTSISVDPKIAETNTCHDEVGNHNNHGSVAGIETTSCTEGVRETGSEADSSSTSEVCQSPMCETSVEAEGSTFSGSSQERKQRQGRRSGKQCKLALTFTQNCPAPPLNIPENPCSSTQNIDRNQTSINANDSSCNSSLNQTPNFDLFTASKPEAQVRPSSPPVSPADGGCSTQTEPQDFALLWRLNRHDRPADCSHSSDITVLSGDSSRFIPELSSTVYAAVAVQPFSHSEVLYHVMHEKGTQVEEKDFGGTQDRLESLCILSRHFKRVSFDTLEDLYDKCHQDLEWTTNLLLDSGEKFYKEEDDGKEEEEDDAGGAQCEVDQNTSDLCGVVGKVVVTSICPDVSDECHSEYLSKGGPAGFVEGTGQSTCGPVSKSNDSSTYMDISSVEGAPASVRSRDHSDTTPCPEKTHLTELAARTSTTEGDDTEPYLEAGACGGIIDEGILIELLQAELEELEREEKQREKEKTEKTHGKERGGSHLDIQSVELKLPTELALQLTELFGPVGVDPGTCSSDDYAVQMDLNLAKLLHQKWKETIQERHRQASLSFHLLQESSVRWGESQGAKHGSQERTQPANYLSSASGYTSLNSQPEVRGQLPFMDHWNVSRPHVSLRDIIKEELALQNMERTRQSHADLDHRDGATLLKENKLYSRFPTIDRQFLHDIFRDHNYSFTQTELFLCSLLDEQPVKTVVAPEAPQSDHHRAASKEREKRQKPLESNMSNYQDFKDPQYDDFRAEADLQRSRQLESFAKAAEAYKQGRKDVASFYAQQGQMHGQRMREANRRAAINIFERVNASLLPQNILDLHGLHVDEALSHLAKVLEDKTKDCERGLCRPQLSVITGRGNHSQGGVARIRPAVIDYLSKKHYRFTEPKPGLMLVSLK